MVKTIKKESWLIGVGLCIGIYSSPIALYHANKVISVEIEPNNYGELLKNIQVIISHEIIEVVL